MFSRLSLGHVSPQIVVGLVKMGLQQNMLKDIRGYIFCISCLGWKRKKEKKKKQFQRAGPPYFPFLFLPAPESAITQAPSFSLCTIARCVRVHAVLDK